MCSPYSAAVASAVAEYVCCLVSCATSDLYGTVAGLYSESVGCSVVWDAGTGCGLPCVLPVVSKVEFGSSVGYLFAASDVADGYAVGADTSVVDSSGVGSEYSAAAGFG